MESTNYIQITLSQYCSQLSHIQYVGVIVHHLHCILFYLYVFLVRRGTAGEK